MQENHSIHWVPGTMDDQTNHVREYLAVIWNITMHMVNLISTIFRVLFWILFTFIIAAIFYDIGLYGLRAFAARFGIGAGASPRSTKTIDADKSPTQETAPTVPNGNSKKDR